MDKERKEKLAYISLQEASKSCNYSQEYLSLRARQGKLKSAKFGRNWVTTKEWLEEYIKKSEDYNLNHNGNHNGNGHKAGYIKDIKNHSPLALIGIADVDEDKKIKIIKIPHNLPIDKEPALNFNFTAALVIFLFLTISIFSQKFLLDSALKRSPYQSQEISKIIYDQKVNINSEILTADLQGKIGQYFQALWIGLKIQFANLKSRIIVFKESSSEKSVEENNKEGIVVIPSIEENEAMKTRIQKSFSDEVKVEPKDDSSGIITPVFQKGDGEEYFYIMVPIKN